MIWRMAGFYADGLEAAHGHMAVRNIAAAHHRAGVILRES
jgi:hypothetical protein